MKKWIQLVLEFYGTVGVPIVYALGLVIIAFTPQRVWSLPIQIMGLVGVGVGLTLWVASYINLGSSFGVLPRRQVKVKRGLYRYIPHPMYVGIVFTYLGLSLAAGSIGGLVYVVGLLLPLLIVRAHYESKMLEA